MTTNGSQLTTQCSHCVEHEATRAAAVAEAAVLRTQAQLALGIYRSFWSLGTAPLDDVMSILSAMLADENPAVNALERRLKQADTMAELLTSVDALLDKFCATESEDDIWPLSADERIKIILERLERAEALAALVPDPLLLRALACWAGIEPQKNESVGHVEIDEMAEEARALAARIEEAQKLVPDLTSERTSPCSHPGCYSHVTHPCEGCGRLQGYVPMRRIEEVQQRGQGDGGGDGS